MKLAENVWKRLVASKEKRFFYPSMLNVSVERILGAVEDIIGKMKRRLEADCDSMKPKIFFAFSVAQYVDLSY